MGPECDAHGLGPQRHCVEHLRSSSCFLADGGHTKLFAFPRALLGRFFT